MEQSDFNRFVKDRGEEGASEAIGSHSAVVCLAQPGVPVIYVSDAFESHTGYRLEDVAGRSLGLLQGPDTEPEAIDHFRNLIKNGQSGTVRITNYRKNGERFVHECELRPILDDGKNVTHFIAIQRPV
ncbi:PAS domain-containing protein [Ruegeria sp. SCPT10]|uniref:PAS domain-containing protein n=1 Tax=Ruegeria sp. SCP10 TaxID=3141377 RepID=UPI00333D08D1